MAVNVHVEPDPRYPEALGVIIGDFNICEAEEGRFNVLEKATQVKQLSSVLFFRMSLKSCSRTFQGRRLLLMVRYAHYPELTGRLLIYLRLENGPYQVTTLQCESSCRNRPSQAYSELDVQTSCVLLCLEKDR